MCFEDIQLAKRRQFRIITGAGGTFSFPGDGSRVVILLATFSTLAADVITLLQFDPVTGNQGSIMVNVGNPMFMMRFEDFGPLVQQPFRIVGGGNWTLTQIFDRDLDTGPPPATPPNFVAP